MTDTTSKKIDWTPNTALPVGKGATYQQSDATIGSDRLEIETTAWGEGDLRINGAEVAHVCDEASQLQAFQDLERAAETVENGAGKAKRDDADRVAESLRPRSGPSERRTLAMPTKPLIAVTDYVFPSLDPTMAALAHLDPEMHVAKSAAADDILAVARDADAILVTFAKLPAELIRQLNRCKAIGRFGIGVDNIDLHAAAEKGITVTYVPDYCVGEVSDHAMALLLALARKIPFSNKLVQSGCWELPPVAPIYRLDGRVLGLVGFGNIPRQLVPKAKAFGIRVVVHDPYVSQAELAAAGVEGVGFDRLLQIADFVSVHAPLTPTTRGLFNAETFRKMKPGALLVNTARGPLVDEVALVEALDTGQVGGAALDVVATEPLTGNSKLLGRDNVILTPHTAFYSEEALHDVQTKCASDVARVLSGEAPICPIKAL